MSIFSKPLSSTLVLATKKVIDQEAAQGEQEDEQSPKQLGNHVSRALEDLNDDEDIENENDEADEGTVTVVHKKL